MTFNLTQASDCVIEVINLAAWEATATTSTRAIMYSMVETRCYENNSQCWRGSKNTLLTWKFFVHPADAFIFCKWGVQEYTAQFRGTHGRWWGWRWCSKSGGPCNGQFQNLECLFPVHTLKTKQSVLGLATTEKTRMMNPSDTPSQFKETPSQFRKSKS